MACWKSKRRMTFPMSKIKALIAMKAAHCRRLPPPLKRPEAGDLYPSRRRRQVGGIPSYGKMKSTDRRDMDNNSRPFMSIFRLRHVLIPAMAVIVACRAASAETADLQQRIDALAQPL